MDDIGRLAECGQRSEAVNRVIAMIGVVLLIAGLVFIFSLGSLLYQAFENPEQSKAFLFIQKTLSAEGQLISGKMDGKEFEIQMNEDVRNFGLILMAIFGISIVFGLLNSLIMTGASLLKLSQSRPIKVMSKN